MKKVLKKYTFLVLMESFLYMLKVYFSEVLKSILLRSIGLVSLLFYAVSATMAI